MTVDTSWPSLLFGGFGIFLLLVSLLIVLRPRGDGGSNNGWQLSRLEKKVDLLLDHYGLKYQEDYLAECRRLVRDGQKIEAIRYYRQHTGAGLKDAKDAIDALGPGSF